jgi:putative heme-binding domain-containing protein
MSAELFKILKQAGNDRMLEHSLLYALIQSNIQELAVRSKNNPNRANYEFAYPNLRAADPTLRRAALITLDQSEDPRLTRDILAKLLDTDDVRLQRTALGVMQRHPDWGDGILDYLKRKLAAASVPDDEAELLRDTILAYKADARVQEIVADALDDANLSPSQRRLLLEVVERSEFGPTTLPPTWADQIAAHLLATDDAVVRQAVTVAVRIGGDRFDGALLAIGNNTAKNEALRIAALDAVGARLPRLEPATFTMLTTRLTTAADSLDRLAAADVLGQAPLDAAQRAVVVAAVAKAGPLELPPLLSLFTKDTSPDECRDLLKALAASPGLENMPSSTLEKIVGSQPEDVRELAEPLFKRINADIETQRARLAELLPTLDGGDKARGAIVFQMHKTACNSCHRVGTKGAAIGPDLTKVGQIRAKADILESVLYPSASFVRNFESVAVETSDGRVVVGLLARETPEAVYIRTAQKEEVRVPRSDVETLAPSKLSIMPQGLDKVMTKDELRDLVAYLQSLK